MRRMLFSGICAGLLFIIGCSGTGTESVLDVSGHWEGSYSATERNNPRRMEDGSITMDLLQEGSSIQGSLWLKDVGEGPVSGVISDDIISVSINFGMGTGNWTGTVTETSMTLVGETFTGNETWETGIVLNRASEEVISQE